MSYDNIPQEMRRYDQWVVWKYEGTNGEKPTKVPYDPKTGNLANVNDPSTWADYFTAVTAAQSYSGLGFVLTENDPYTFIDLDDAEGDPEVQQNQIYIYNQFETYSELSPSGNGLHLILKGHVPSGRRRSKIEVYSSQRYMTMTGQVYRNAPIELRQGMLEILWDNMGKSRGVPVYTGDDPQLEDDTAIIAQAAGAINGAKFTALYNGEWQRLYPSQSEADFALIDIIAYYTKNRDQIVRIFRNSALGQRQKANRQDYVNAMVVRSFDRMVPPIVFEDYRNDIEDFRARQRKTGTTEEQSRPFSDAAQGHTVSADSIEAIIGQPVNVKAVPPGLLCDVAAYIYNAAPRPVPEIAIAASIGFMSGICGRAWNVSNTGLNMYILLLAPTGTGKEAMASGISNIIQLVQPKVPAITKFIGPAEIASGQALLKYLNDKSQCFVSIVGEFGILLKTLASNYANNAQLAFKRALLDLYHKSGKNERLLQTIYSERAKDTDVVRSPAVSILGESEPEGFYAVLDETIVASGLLPRINIIEYHGPRVPLNPHHLSVTVPEDIITRVSQLAVYAHELMQRNIAIDVQFDDESAAMSQRFDVWCDAKINTAERDVYRQLWNRAHLKAMKLAALVAVGRNTTRPVVEADAMRWAISVVVADAENLLKRFEVGDIGDEASEAKQLRLMKEFLYKYIMTDFYQLKGRDRVTYEMHKDGRFTWSYIHAHFYKNKAFKNKFNKATPQIREAIQTLEANGVILKMHKSAGQAEEYQIVNPKGLEE